MSIKPQELGHEAHCSAFSRPDDDCCCFYPELERLWKREALLVKALNLIHDGICTDHTQDGVDQVKLGIRQVLKQHTT